VDQLIDITNKLTVKKQDEIDLVWYMVFEAERMLEYMEQDLVRFHTHVAIGYEVLCLANKVLGDV